MVKKRNGGIIRMTGRMFVVLLVFGVAIFTLSYKLVVNLRHINDMNRELIVLEKEKTILLDKEESLEADIKKLLDPLYIARYAREKYLYSKEGELILRIN